MFDLAYDCGFYAEQDQYEARCEYEDSKEELDRRYEHMVRMAHCDESPEVVE